MAPTFKHDCKECTFLGNYNGADLYFCPQTFPTVIARTGNEGPNYKSGISIAKIPFGDANVVPTLRVAYLIALDLGLAG